MISVVETRVEVLNHAQPLSPVTLPVGSATVGLVLAEEVVSDLAVPPFDQAMMDGYAVRATDLADGHGSLQVIEEIAAGHQPRLPLGPGQATRLTTGAPIPAGADAVVAVERTRWDGDRVHVDDSPKVGQNILPEGCQMRLGEVVFGPGAVLRPQEFGLLATLGRTEVRVHPRPRVAIISIGEEVSQQSGPGQISNGNGPMLLAQVCRAGGLAHLLVSARDTPESPRSLINEGLESDVLLLSCGVSAGKLNLVRGILKELRVQAQFHEVDIEPANRLLFGVRGSTLVFGLPGDPVSSMVSFELFVRPAIQRLLGHAEVRPDTIVAKLVDSYVYRSERGTYHPAWLERYTTRSRTADRVRLVPWLGPPDLRGLMQANSFAILWHDKEYLRAGEFLTVIAVEDLVDSPD